MLHRRAFGLLGAALLLTGVALDAVAAEKRSWDEAISRFEEADKAQPPAPGGIVFVGGSSIRLWDLKESFPDQTLINRGFGGSQLIDSVQYADRIINKYRPRLVVVYAGDNDLAAGKSAEQVRDDYRALVAKIHTALPETKIVFLAIKPSIARAKLIETQKKTNQMIADDIARDPRLVFLDIGTPLLDVDGKPRPELFVKDGLHLSKAGYAIWTGLVAPLLK